MPADYTSYPQPDDLQAYVTSLGVLAPDDGGGFGSLDLPGKCEAAADAWETRTLWRPYLSSGNAETRQFDPPRGSRLLVLGRAGLLSLAALTVAGTAYTPGQDFWLVDANAPAEGMPYTAVQFRFPLAHTLPQQVAITGAWGRTQALAASDWQAILQYAAFLAYPEIALRVSRGLYEVRDLNLALRYAGAGQSPLSAESATWEKRFEAAVRRRRRVAV